MTQVALPTYHPAHWTLSVLRRLTRVQILSLAVLALVLGWALAPALFTGLSPMLGDAAHALQPPSAQHWFGTDYLGRDLYTRTVYGSALSLKTAILAVSIALLAGSLIGIASGYCGGLLDSVLSRLIEVLMAVPSLLLAMAVITVLGFGTLNLALAVAVSSVATFARLSRGEVLRCKHQVFVEAARACGVRSSHIVARHILPHIAAPIVGLAALEFGFAILAVSALSFLGFGAPPPQPEWGQLVSEGRNYIVFAWWCTTLPGLVIAGVVLATHQLSQSLHPYQGKG